MTEHELMSVVRGPPLLQNFESCKQKSAGDMIQAHIFVHSHKIPIATAFLASSGAMLFLQRYFSTSLGIRLIGNWIKRPSISASHIVARAGGWSCSWQHELIKIPVSSRGYNTD